MPRNPLMNNGRTDAQNNGLTHDPKSVNPEKNYGQSLHQFNNSYIHATTERYADVSPFMALDVIPGDVVPFSSKHNVRTYTLSSPIEDTINKRKFYTIVPMRAILPKTWKLFYANPTHGDDVPEDCYCNSSFVLHWKYVHNEAVSDFVFDKAFRFILATELIFSTGALPAKFKLNLWPMLYKDKSNNLDVALDSFYSQVLPYLIIAVSPSDETVIRYSLNGIDGSKVISAHDMLDIMRTGNFIFSAISAENQSIVDQLTLEFLDTTIPNLLNTEVYTSLNSVKFDMSKFISYQISCMSQVSDSSIDYIFNAQLYRDLLFPDNDFRFSYNGHYVDYDVFSQNYFDELWFRGIDMFVEKVPYIFNYNKSLKFGDYFTTARPQPLAVGDTTIDVDGNSVNSIDVARKLVYTRFLNWSNRVGPKYEDYIKKLTGMSALPDPTEPAFIGSSHSVVSGYEVENTGTEQRDLETITTIINSSRNDFEFNITVSEPSIILGLTCYDVARLYTRGIDRSFFKADRFDFFNHLLQYTGDQDINGLELDSSFGNRPIAYTTKDMHYKQQVSHASGGFLTAVSHWAYTTENDILSVMTVGINPFFVRNFNGAFDVFYSSLTGLSLGTYFHFICRYYNDFSTMKRPMDVAPDIL